MACSLAQHLLRLCGQTGREFLGDLLRFDQVGFFGGDGSAALFGYAGFVGGFGWRRPGFGFYGPLGHGYLSQ